MIRKRAQLERDCYRVEELSNNNLHGLINYNRPGEVKEKGAVIVVFSIRSGVVHFRLKYIGLY